MTETYESLSSRESQVRAVLDIMTRYGDVSKIISEIKSLETDVSQDVIDNAAKVAVAKRVAMNRERIDLDAPDYLQLKDGLGISDEAFKDGLKDGVADALGYGAGDGPVGKFLYEEDSKNFDAFLGMLESSFGLTDADFADIGRRALEKYAGDSEISARIKEVFAITQ